MSRPIAVLRPQPGNRATAAAIAAHGRTAIAMPLFEVRPLAWQAPDPGDFDALILTSANAVRHGGAALRGLASLPVHAVGEATAKAASDAGFAVVAVGRNGAGELVSAAEAAGVRRALHLAGRDHTLQPGGIVKRIVPVYASEPLPVPPEALGRLAGTIVLVQSARAARRLDALVAAALRRRIALVAISAKVAAAAGDGWEALAIASGTSSGALIDTAIALAD